MLDKYFCLKKSENLDFVKNNKNSQNDKIMNKFN